MKQSNAHLLDEIFYLARNIGQLQLKPPKALNSNCKMGPIDYSKVPQSLHVNRNVRKCTLGHVAQGSFRSDCAFAQSDLNLHWAHFQ